MSAVFWRTHLQRHCRTLEVMHSLQVELVNESKPLSALSLEAAVAVGSVPTAPCCKLGPGMSCASAPPP